MDCRRSQFVILHSPASILSSSLPPILEHVIERLIRREGRGEQSAHAGGGGGDDQGEIERRVGADGGEKFSRGGGFGRPGDAPAGVADVPFRKEYRFTGEG